MKLETDAVAASTLNHGDTHHPDDVPKAAGFVLAPDLGRDCDILVPDGARQECTVFDARLTGGLGDFDLLAILDGLFAGVGTDYGTEEGFDGVDFRHSIYF